MKNRSVRRRPTVAANASSRTGRVLKAAVATSALGVAPVSLAAFPSDAAASTWREVQHNIMGAANGADGNVAQVSLFKGEVAYYDPFAASANEICASQVWNAALSLAADYEIYFGVAKQSVPGCGAYGGAVAGDFGNMLIVAKDVTPARDATWTGYRQVGNPQNEHTHIYSHNYNTTEHKRNDCAWVAGSNATTKFKVCTTHTTAQDSNGEIQINELRANPGLVAPTMYIGDFNESSWIVNNLATWRWDTLNTGDSTLTTGNSKYDWVLGESDGNFTRAASSVLAGPTGPGGGWSDHFLLTAFLRAN